MIRRLPSKKPLIIPSSKLIQFFAIIIFLVLIFFLFYSFGGNFLLPKNRYSLVILGDPVEIVSLGRENTEIVTIRFPKDTKVSGISGLGSYRLDALWSVAATGASPSAIVLESLTDEFGVPLDRYIADKNNIWKKRDSNGPVYPEVFSLINIYKFIKGGFETNIPLNEYIGFLKATSSINPARINELELTPDYGLTEIIEPDGVKSYFFDRTSFDRKTEDIFQDSIIRQEGLRISVLNTTGKEQLGRRAARIVDKLGAHVILVGNDVNLAESCDLVGSRKALSTRTASVLKQIFNCVDRITEEQSAADIILRLGKSYAERYAPKN